MKSGDSCGIFHFDLCGFLYLPDFCSRGLTLHNMSESSNRWRGVKEREDKRGGSSITAYTPDSRCLFILRITNVILHINLFMFWIWQICIFLCSYVSFSISIHLSTVYIYLSHTHTCCSWMFVDFQKYKVLFMRVNCGFSPFIAFHRPNEKVIHRHCGWCPYHFRKHNLFHLKHAHAFVYKLH